MTGFPIGEQPQLLKLAAAANIGVSLTAAGVMVPRKSASAVIGLGPGMPAWTKTGECARCHLKETCRYRLAPARQEELA